MSWNWLWLLWPVSGFIGWAWCNWLITRASEPMQSFVKWLACLMSLIVGPIAIASALLMALCDSRRPHFGLRFR